MTVVFSHSARDFLMLNECFEPLLRRFTASRSIPLRMLHSSYVMLHLKIHFSEHHCIIDNDFLVSHFTQITVNV